MFDAMKEGRKQMGRRKREQEKRGSWKKMKEESTDRKERD
jgi:hypothetical protein